MQQPILLGVSEGREQEAVTRLSRVGFDHTLGYLQGGVAAWQAAGKDLVATQSVSAEALEAALDRQPLVYDVRKPGEFNKGHLEMAQHTPLSQLNDYLDAFPKDQPFYVHCAGGYRSVIAASILEKRGIDGAINVEGGFKAMKNTTMPIVTD